MYSVGDVVEHKLSGTWLTVLELYGEDKVILRTKDFKTIELYKWEVKKVSFRKE